MCFGGIARADMKQFKEKLDFTKNHFTFRT